MPKSKHRRKGDKRPVRRSGKNEGPTDYRTARPVREYSDEKIPETNRQCPYLDRIATLSNVFTKEECTDIINNALNNWGERESQIQRDKDGKIEQNFEHDLDYRNTTLFIPPKPDDWLFGQILGAILEFNNSKDGYQFEISGLAEPPNLMRYHAPDIDKNGKPGKYDWHIDVGPGPIPSMRKHSNSILLNPGEYEGGDFITKIGRSDVGFEKNWIKAAEIQQPSLPVEDMIGTMILFPSYILHRVDAVTKGTRYSMVGWAHGNSFK